jgi:hypothetical protein
MTLSLIARPTPATEGNHGLGKSEGSFALSDRFTQHISYLTAKRRDERHFPEFQRAQALHYSPDRAKLRELYDSIASTYEQSHYGQLETAVRQIPTALNQMHTLPNRPLDVLELGSGNGRTSTLVLAQSLRTGRPGSRLVGVDLSAEMIA